MYKIAKIRLEEILISLKDISLGTIIVSILLPVIIVCLTYFFGLRQYLKQKEKERAENYIKNGIDQVINDLSGAYTIVFFNYGKACRVVEYLQNSSDKDIGKDVVRKVFSEMEKLIIAPNISIYRLGILVGGDGVEKSFRWIIDAIADYTQFNDYLRYVFLLEVEYYFKYSERLPKDKFVKESQKTINRIFNKVVSRNSI